MSDIRERFERDGRVWFRNALTPDELAELQKMYQSAGQPGARLTPNSALFQSVASARFNRDLQALWSDMRPVRMVAFDKSADANWGVSWHQDRVIAVADKVDVPGYGNWSQKQGIWHCEPPEGVLQNMLFVRVHLDACTVSNGSMEIALGSHNAGKVTAAQVASVATSYPTELTLAEPGDVLVLAMLTLHRSAPSITAVPRRVLRVDYAADNLPGAIGWQ